MGPKQPDEVGTALSHPVCRGVTLGVRLLARGHVTSQITSHVTSQWLEPGFEP